MVAIATRVDSLIAHSRIFWRWLGQAGVVVLGIHLGADQLDDWIAALLSRAPWAWPTADLPLVAGAWGAVAVELLLVVKIADALLLTPQEPTLSWRGWYDSRSVDAVVLPLFWGICALAGAWTVGMAVEDALAGLHAQAAFAAGVAAAALAAWRLGWSGLTRVVAGLADPRTRLRGLRWAPLLIGVGYLAARHGLPLWGWL